MKITGQEYELYMIHRGVLKNYVSGLDHSNKQIMNLKRCLVDSTTEPFTNDALICMETVKVHWLSQLTALPHKEVRSILDSWLSKGGPKYIKFLAALMDVYPVSVGTYYLNSQADLDKLEILEQYAQKYGVSDRETLRNKCYQLGLFLDDMTLRLLAKSLTRPVPIENIVKVLHAVKVLSSKLVEMVDFQFPVYMPITQTQKVEVGVHGFVVPYFASATTNKGLIDGDWVKFYVSIEDIISTAFIGFGDTMFREVVLVGGDRVSIEVGP